jgi:acetolactate synthase-1/2/3 large subunit
MNIQELQVLKEYNLNVKVIVINNSFLGMVRQWQDLFFDKNYAFTPISSPNYEKLAQAY